MMSSDTPEKHPRRWPWIVGILAAAVLAYLIFRPGAGAEDKKKTPPPVPVVAVAARTADMGVYLSALGSVSALQTVTVRSRVDGQLVDVRFREGQFVRAGDLLAEIDPRPFQVQLTQAEGQRAKDEAALKNARLDLERYRVLAANDSIPRQQLDTQAAVVAQDEGTVKSDQGQIESARLNLVYSRITAPISGRVGLRQVDAGNMVHASDAGGLVVITQVQPIAVLFTIPEDNLPAVLQRMRAGKKLSVDAWDRDRKNRLATGLLLTTDNQIDASTGTVKLKAVFGNSDNALFPNQFVNARLLLDTLKNAVVVPTAAIQKSPQSTFAFVVKPDSTVMMRPVEVGYTEGDDCAIRKGLAAGEVVVVEGVDKLQEGTKVAVRLPEGPAGGARKRRA
jgi:multidrug efflux system membrane fusion protein